MHRKYVNKFSFYLNTSIQQCANHSRVALKFTKVLSSFPVFRKPIKQVFEVCFRTIEFHQARTKKNVFIQLNYYDL